MSDKKQHGTKNQKTSPLGKLATPGGSGATSRTLVPPMLHEVGKLAASVASVSTSPGSATGNCNLDLNFVWRETQKTMFG